MTGSEPLTIVAGDGQPYLERHPQEEEWIAHAYWYRGWAEEAVAQLGSERRWRIAPIQDKLAWLLELQRSGVKYVQICVGDEFHGGLALSTHTVVAAIAQERARLTRSAPARNEPPAGSMVSRPEHRTRDSRGIE